MNILYMHELLIVHAQRNFNSNHSMAIETYDDFWGFLDNFSQVRTPWFSIILYTYVYTHIDGAISIHRLSSSKVQLMYTHNHVICKEIERHRYQKPKMV
jgi:hypothetical protein